MKINRKTLSLSEWKVFFILLSMIWVGRSNPQRGYRLYGYPLRSSMYQRWKLYWFPTVSTTCTSNCGAAILTVPSFITAVVIPLWNRLRESSSSYPFIKSVCTEPNITLLEMLILANFSTASSSFVQPKTTMANRDMTMNRCVRNEPPPYRINITKTRVVAQFSS